MPDRQPPIRETATEARAGVNVRGMTVVVVVSVLLAALALGVVALLAD